MYIPRPSFFSLKNAGIPQKEYEKKNLNEEGKALLELASLSY